MTARAYDILLGFMVTFALGVAVSSLAIRLWYRYVVGACAADWTLAVVLGLVVAVGTTVLEVWVARAGGE